VCYAEALPLAHYLCLTDTDFTSALRRHLGLSNVPCEARHMLLWQPDGLLIWSMPVRAPPPSVLHVLCQNTVVEVVRRALHRGGITSSKEALLATLYQAAAASPAASLAMHDLCMGLTSAATPHPSQCHPPPQLASS
jgi:hypothetical protein